MIEDFRDEHQKAIDRAAAWRPFHLQAAQSGESIGEKYEYDITLGWGAIVSGGLKVRFKDKGIIFKGWTLGPSAGGFFGWGTAVLNFPLEQIVNWEARYAIEGASFLGGGAGAQLFGLDGNKICNASAGGTGLGSIFGGGKEQFLKDD